MISYFYSTITACRAEAKRFGKPCFLFYDVHKGGYFYATDLPDYVAGAFPFSFLVGECNQEEKKEEPMPEIKCPTKEQILKGAEKSQEAKEVLKELFPEVFEPKILSCHELNENMNIRRCGNYKNKSIWLSPYLDWGIVTDDLGVKVLIATKKT